MRGKRGAVATVAALVSFWALYVVAINTFLRTSLFDRVVNHSGMPLDIHYEGGWSLWPSTIHAKHLSIRSEDSNVMWILKLDEVTFDVSLLSLPRRRFQIDKARGSGISMRLQTKRMTWPDTQEEIADLPPIAGFPAFAVRPADPHHPELWDDDQYELITVRLDDVVASDVREIWINDHRFSGHATVSGRFYLKPLRAVEVGPLHVDVQSGQLNQGLRRALATNLGGTVDLEVDHFDPRAVSDNEVLRYFNIGTNLRARSTDIANMPYSLPAGLYASGEVDANPIAIHIERGKLAPGTRIHASVNGASLAGRNYIGQGALDVDARVDPEPAVHGTAQPRLHAETTFATWRIVRADSTELFHAPRAYFRLDSAALDLATTPFEDVHVQAVVEDATVQDARVANCILPCTVRVRSGSAVLNARAELWPNENRIAASAKLKYDDVHATIPGLEGRGSGVVQASFGEYRWDTGEMTGAVMQGDFHDAWMKAQTLPLRHGKMNDGTIAIRVERFNLADPLHALDATIAIPKGSDAAFDLALGEKNLHGSGILGVLGHVTLVDRELTGFDAKVDLRDVELDHGVTIAGAAVTTLGEGKNLEFTAHVEDGRLTHPDAVTFLPVKLAGNDGRFHGDVHFESVDGVARARATIATERLGIRKNELVVIGDADIALDVRRFVKSRNLDLGPSKFEVRHVVATVAGRPAFKADRVQVDGIAKELDLVVPDSKSVAAHVVLAGVSTTDAAAFQPLLSPKSKIRITSGGVDVNGEIAFAGTDGASGEIVVAAKRAGFVFGESSLIADGKLEAKVNGIGDNLIDISGSKLAVREVEVRHSSFETSHWHGDVALDDAAIDWASGTPAVAADISLKAEDARPVLGMVHVPKIAGGLVEMPNIALRAHLDADPDGILLRDIYAHGGDVAFRGSYAVHDGDKKGAFVVAKGPVSVGVRLGNDGAHPRFFGLDGWLNEEEKKVKAAPIAPGKP